MPNQKENKTKIETKIAPPQNETANQNNPPEKKKNSACLPLAIVGMAFLLFIIFILVWMWPFIFSFLLDLRSGDLSLPKMSESASKGTLKGKNLASLIDPSKTITKRISAKKGGRITVQTASGLYFTLNIGPGSLERDTDITLTPIKESPIEGYPDPDDPGVVIGPDDTSLGDGSTVTVSEDPPADPGDSGADPGTGTDGGTTTPPGTSGDVPDLGGLLDLLGNNSTMTAPSENLPGQDGGVTGNTGTNRDDRNTGSGSSSGSGAGPSRFSDTTVIIFVGYGGGVNPVPTTYSDDGDEITGPIDETGGTATDDPDEEESEDLADNAATVSGGTCSPEFLQTMANASQAGGAGSSAAQAAIRDCLNTEWLNNLCVNDPVKLRRTYFEQRLAIARRFDAQAAAVIESLMNQCQARYRFQGEGINPQSSGGVTIFSSLDANVCGYIDDQWTGIEVYKLSAGQGTFHTIEGTAEFKLPPSGGSFAGTAHGSNDMAVIGRGVAIPNFEAGFTANFDGIKNIQNLYLVPAGVVVSSAPIELQERECVPIAPLPR